MSILQDFKKACAADTTRRVPVLPVSSYDYVEIAKKDPNWVCDAHYFDMPDLEDRFKRFHENFNNPDCYPDFMNDHVFYFLAKCKNNVINVDGLIVNLDDNLSIKHECYTSEFDPRKGDKGLCKFKGVIKCPLCNTKLMERSQYRMMKTLYKIGYLPALLKYAGSAILPRTTEEINKLMPAFNQPTYSNI